jgi:sugar/nucleoside kinase (ribokinase family)
MPASPRSPREHSSRAVSDLDLLVIGDCNPDLVLSGDDVEPAFGQVERVVDEARLEIGGSASIAACAAARLGLRTALVSVVGDDVFGRFMLDALDERGVRTAWCTRDPRTPTGLTVILTRPDGDRAILTAPGTLATVGAQHVPPEALHAARHVHVGGYFLLPGLQASLAEIFQAARAAGATTSLDTGWDPTERWGGELAAVLGQTDWLFPNAQEARRIAGVSDLEGATEKLAAGGTGVVAKLGTEGAVARRGDELARAAALRVAVVDTIGAGDCFAAGFLAGQLQGMALERSLALACACGSLSTRSAGGTAGQPTLSEALQAIDEPREGP